MINFGSNKYIVTDDGTRYKKAGFLRTAGAFAAGNVVKDVVSAASIPVGLIVVNSFKKCNNDFSKEIDSAFSVSKLADKGVRILDVSKHNISIKDIFPKFCRKILPMEVKEVIKNFYSTLIKDGKNAFFTPFTNRIIINKEKMGIAAFHEMGHALNYNMGKVTKLLQGLRLPSMLGASMIATVALLKRKKVEGEEQKGWFDKTTDFVKNNCGKLTALAFAPILLEEGLATFKGEALAKKAGMATDKLKMLKGFNRKAYMTYVATTAAATAGIVLGNKLRDKIAAPKVVEK